MRVARELRHYLRWLELPAGADPQLVTAQRHTNKSAKGVEKMAKKTRVITTQSVHGIRFSIEVPE